jgi:tryptophan-rich sensory protein
VNAIAANDRLKPVAVAAGIALLVALVGGLMTDIGPWYASLAKPAWQPPNWLFGPAWTLIYALAVAAGSLAWFASDTRTKRQNLLIVFFLNALLNVGWSLLFFRLRRPDLALVEVAFLWSSIVLLIYVCVRRRKLAGGLLLPYLLWVTFAAFLNAEIVRLNYMS